MLNGLTHGAFDPGGFSALRATEFAHLDVHDVTYLDYTGAAIPAASQLRAHAALLQGALLGNPHSENSPSRTSSDIIEGARADVLDFFNADPAQYSVCFTANTSAAIKLVAESFPFRRGSRFILSADNHNSVNGIVEFARRREAVIGTIPLTSELRLRAPVSHLDTSVGGAPSLFAFPAQSNFSGVRHPLSLIGAAQQRGFKVLLDAAAFVPTSPLDLRAVQPDFVALSFYKMFGFPTGVGALIVRNDVLDTLERPWFAGGTVAWASVQHRDHRLRSSVEKLEDGTPNYYSIAALRPGLGFLRRINLARVSAHVSSLTQRARALMSVARHAGGAPVFRLYGPRSAEGQGGTIAVNLIDASGSVVPYDMAERRAREAGIAVRGGCFCNPGAAERAFGFEARATARCFRRTHQQAFSPQLLGRCLGASYAVGAIRFSFGVATSERDVDAGVQALASIARDATVRRVS